jgi:pyridoxal phosphate enzyme (YggS family)
MSIADNISSIKDNIEKTSNKFHRNADEIHLVAVSKTIQKEEIIQAINAGCRVFGENKVLESKDKWPELKKNYPDIKLHLIGHLQSNKAKEAVALFDVIETLDSAKLAEVLKKEMDRQRKYPEIFVQINIGEEPQKSGIIPLNATNFIQSMIKDYNLPISGVMGIAPLGKDPSLYFALLTKIARENNLKNISMGMSADFEKAIALGANFIRLGSAIFGNRKE